MRESENNKTIRQWALLGRIPKDGAEPSYVWTVNANGTGKATTIYYREEDTREMTIEEKSAFDEMDLKKHPNRDGETAAHKRNRMAYEKNQEAYEVWAEQRSVFNQRNRDRYYYRKGVTRAKRRELAEWVLRDFPKAAFRETVEQIGGCREIVWEFGLWETEHDPYWVENVDLHRIFSLIKRYPKDVQLAIDNPDGFAKKGFGVTATDVRRYLPRIIKDIGKGIVW